MKKARKIIKITYLQTGGLIAQGIQRNDVMPFDDNYYNGQKRSLLAWMYIISSPLFPLFWLKIGLPKSYLPLVNKS